MDTLDEARKEIEELTREIDILKEKIDDCAKFGIRVSQYDLAKLRTLHYYRAELRDLIER